MEKASYTCIVCPLSCKGTLTLDQDGYATEGYLCKKGTEYAINEYTNPKRMLTTTVKINHGMYPNLPVVSNKEIEKSMMFTCLELLHHLQVEAPVKAGDIIAKDICGTGVDIIAGRNMKRKT